MVLNLLGSWACPKCGWKLWAHKIAPYTLTLSVPTVPAEFTDPRAYPVSQGDSSFSKEKIDKCQGFLPQARC